ncbi:MAG: HupE/UreJ family protein [Bacteroidetes bacterium]|nr:HupE/UreJ family protein [Bacteroidota bacterium]
MNDFYFYFKLGWEHIISWDATDHLLFILALSAIYLVQNSKQLLILITAFTVGHSLTLALSVYELVQVSSKWVEFLIPVTIMATGLFNLLQKNREPSSLQLNYLLALLFGLIHGLGFANNIRFMLASAQKIAIPLFGFNVGLEAGQILVVCVILLTSFLFVNRLKVQRKWWVTSVSVFAIIMASYMAFTRLPF